MIQASLTQPTWFIDCDSAEIGHFVDEALADAPVDDDEHVATALFYAVRDGIRYNPYEISHDRADYRASAVARSRSNWCVPKAVLLTAAARRVGIPARLGFADVRNHLTSERLQATMGTDVFAWHGYSELYIADKWMKVSSAFNIELCDRFGVKALDFDGHHDALMHPYDQAGRRHMEYIRQRGSFDDLPLEEIFADFAVIYPASTTGQAGDSHDDPFAGAPSSASSTSASVVAEKSS
ncbi:MAG: transglutaminase family protein [Ilumatobacteraceae bacterium]